jgi:carbon monoxide dehydrogenase subunit G
MEIENVFEVGAPPDRVYAFLLDVEHIVGCVPGAELVETIDDNTFKGRVKIKVGPITVSYSGNAEIADRDAEAHTAVLKASGRETTGSGSARATATMSVNPKDGGSEVTLSTDFAVAGRVANFGRGVMEDVSRRLVGQMANCIKANLEADGTPATEPPPAVGGGAAAGAAAAGAATAGAATAGAAGETASAGEPLGETAAAPATTTETSAAGAVTQPRTAQPPPAGASPVEAPAAEAPAPAPVATSTTAAPAPAPTPAPRPPITAEAKPINAFGLFFSIVWERIRRLFGGGRS